MRHRYHADSIRYGRCQRHHHPGELADLRSHIMIAFPKSRTSEVEYQSASPRARLRRESVTEHGTRHDPTACARHPETGQAACGERAPTLYEIVQESSDGRFFFSGIPIRAKFLAGGAKGNGKSIHSTARWEGRCTRRILLPC